MGKYKRKSNQSTISENKVRETTTNLLTLRTNSNQSTNMWSKKCKIQYIKTPDEPPYLIYKLNKMTSLTKNQVKSTVIYNKKIINRKNKN